MSHPASSQIQQIYIDDLPPILTELLSRHFGTPIHILHLECQPSAYRTSFAIEELNIELDNGASLALMLKNLGREGLSQDARRTKPAFLYDPLREIEIYRKILEPENLGTATCYGAIVEPQIDRYWLFLEKVQGVEMYQVGDIKIWQQVASWLAAMHMRYQQKIQDLEQRQSERLLHYDRALYRLWLQRAQAFLQRTPSSVPGHIWSGFTHLVQQYEQVIDYLLALPNTFIHGEFYASNVLVGGTPQSLRVCPVDWEMAAIGPGLLDLAALTAGNWTEEQKIAMAMAYHGTLTPEGGKSCELSQLLTALDYCYLQQAVQWLGWSPNWSPPAEHRQNWLRETLRLAEKIGL